jgi:expansin (peptidoglycan-binding protein)
VSRRFILLSQSLIRPGWALAALASLALFLGASAPAADAFNDAFCTGFAAGSYQTCTSASYHYIQWSRVMLDPIESNRQACAGALNSNDVEVGGYVCTTTGLQATNYYDASRYLRGHIKNNTTQFTHMSGNVQY